MTPIIQMEGISNRIGTLMIHSGLNLSVQKGEIMGLIGGSGAGKTTLLRNLLMLLPPQAGHIQLFGVDVLSATEKKRNALRQRLGVMFQSGALFSDLSVLENILFPLRQFAKLDPAFATHLALLKLTLVGLPVSAAHKLPSELSGGMLKRASAARSLALDPELLFLDEPTAGLDPKSSVGLCDLILNLKNMLNLTVVVISHDLMLLDHITDRVAFLGEGKILEQGPIAEVKQNKNKDIQDYFGTQ